MTVGNCGEQTLGQNLDLVLFKVDFVHKELIEVSFGIIVSDYVDPIKLVLLEQIELLLFWFTCDGESFVLLRSIIDSFLIKEIRFGIVDPMNLCTARMIHTFQ